VLAPLLVALTFGKEEPKKPPPPPPPPPAIQITGDSISLQATVPSLAPPGAQAAWLAQIPDTRTVRHGKATINYQVDRTQLEQAVQAAIKANGGTVTLPEHTASAAVSVPVIKQAYRNNCETAALSMLLAADGINVSQTDLLKELPRAAPNDQQTGPSGQPVWGDPDTGFVGDPNGGAKGSGYGVYQGPIRDLAQKHGANVTDLSNSSPDQIYQWLLSGRAVMVWVGLTDGPYQTWKAPDGKQVVGNFGEHTVLLTGINGTTVTVNDPLSGQTDVWTGAYFNQLWQRLGKRALGV
jgi:uncharacterized protein YvpB